jgi:hypothetical protein
VTAGNWSTLGVLALSAALMPFGLIAFSLVLATDRGTRNGIAFILGWIVTVIGIDVVALALGGAVDVPGGGAPSDVALGIEIGLGSVLLMLWIRRRVRRRLGIPDAALPSELDPEPLVVEPPAPAKPRPAWERRIASMGVVGSFVLGGALQPWPVMIAGGAEIAQTDLSVALALPVILAFAIGTAGGIIVLEVLALRSPGSAAARLDRIRTMVETHRDSVINWALLIGGLWLIGRGILGLL